MRWPEEVTISLESRTTIGAVVVALVCALLGVVVGLLIGSWL